MTEVHRAGAYWGRRPEPAETCAQRAASFFQLLSRCDPTYALWYEQAHSTRRALQLQVSLETDTFIRLFSKKKYQSGSDGFSFAAWTGHEDNQGGMALLNCGSLAETSPNSAILYFPSTGPHQDRLLTLPVLNESMRAMALAWEPDWSYVGSDGFRDAFPAGESTDVFMGWMMYFSRQWGQVPALPAPVRVEPVEDKGTLITLGPERLSAANPEHLALGRQVQEILSQHGLLRSIVPSPS